MSDTDNIAEIILNELIEHNRDDEFATHQDIKDIWKIMLNETDIVSQSDVVSTLDKNRYSELEKKIEKIIDDRAGDSVDSQQ